MKQEKKINSIIKLMNESNCNNNSLKEDDKNKETSNPKSWQEMIKNAINDVHNTTNDKSFKIQTVDNAKIILSKISSNKDIITNEVMFKAAEMKYRNKKLKPINCEEIIDEETINLWIKPIIR